MKGGLDQAQATLLGDEAAAWVLRLADGELDEAVVSAFVAWLDGAPVEQPRLRRAAFDRAQAVWLEADRLAALAPDRRVERRRRGGGPSPRRRAPAWPGAVAAASALVLLAGWLIRPSRPAPAPPRPVVAFYTTRDGEHRGLRLADGSRIDMDGDTALAVDLHGRDRRVAMARGEASFDVAHVPSRPFVVELGTAEVRVLGTAFDIARGARGVEVDVARGTVRLRHAESRVDLPAGRGARLDAGGRLTLIAVPVADVAAWREGRRLYRDRPIADVLSDLNRSYAHPLRPGDDGAGAVRFTGVLVLGPREAVVRRLTALLPLVARRSANGEIVLSSRRR